MTDKQQSEVRATAAALETLDMGGVADLVRSQYAELETLRAKLKTYEDLGDAGSDVQLLRMGYDAARLEIESLRGQGWVSLPGALPEPGKPVLLDIGKTYPIRAMWAAKHTVQAADDDTDWVECVEADDMYYAPEGWYEWNECEDNHWRVSETPRAWRELPTTIPAVPGPAEGESNG